MISWEELRKKLDQTLEQLIAQEKETLRKVGPYSVIADDIWKNNTIPSYLKAIQTVSELRQNQFLGVTSDNIPEFAVTLAENILQSANINLDKSSDQFVQFCEATVKMYLEFIQQRIYLNTEAQSFQAVRSSTMLPPQGIVTNNLNGMPISEVIEKYCKEMVVGGNWTPKTESEYRSIYKLLVIITNDITISSVDYQVSQFFKDTLMKLPSNMNKKPLYRDKSVKDVAAMKVPKEDLLSIPKVNAYFSRVSQFFTWACKNGYAQQNPFTGIGIKKKDVPDNEKRIPFEGSDLTALFSTPIASWCVYLNNVCGVNILRIEKTLNDAFGISIHNQTIRRALQYVTRQYQALHDEILQSILSEAVIHIDETTVKLKPLQNGYVWVLTSMDKVYYFYRPTREASFLKEMLAQFKGVLISDFYTGYDSLPCEQQKCLIHLVRDIDDDILRNPFDYELKGMAQAFGTVLRKIVNTIDKFGLKRRHLQKHKKEAQQFLEQLSSAEYSSELASKYKRRFEKNGPKLFAFINHDGVPWNNNNAEHAIKRFARHRRYTGAMSTEQTLKEYLVLSTVFGTCEFNNVNVLEFLLSKVDTLDGLLKIAKRKIRKARTNIASENNDLSKTVETKIDHNKDGIT